MSGTRPASPGSLGLQSASAVAITGGTIAGLTALGLSGSASITKDTAYSSANTAGGIILTGGDAGLAAFADATNNITGFQSYEPGVSFTSRPFVLQPNGGTVRIGLTAPTITGSRGANAALESLLTELATLGLIVDGTTA